MLKNVRGQIRRLLIAILISVILNFVLIIVTSAIDPERLVASRLGTIINALGRPGGAFTEWFSPGHGGIQIAIIIVSSIAFYAGIVWITLTAWNWLRRG